MPVLRVRLLGVSMCLKLRRTLCKHVREVNLCQQHLGLFPI